MVLPTPKVDLTNICSTIYNNTLYTYSPEAFQSLSITEGAKWTQLPMGEVVSGAVCVKATPKDNNTPEALYLVGGTSNTSTTYPGLQRFIFSSGKWETITPLTSVTQNRLYHSAVYLNTSQSILIYAGSQDGQKYPSTQTFTVNTSPPFDVSAYESKGAPPAVQPILLPWSESKAVMLGGGADNKKVFIFSPGAEWVDSNTTLAAPLRDADFVKAVVINGDDGSKNLYTFDMTTSPNTVNRTILVDNEGNPVPTASAIVARSIDNEVLDERLVRRGNLTQSNWPKYNDTLAPAATRNGYALSRDQSGLVIVAGGNKDDVLCMFRARQNAWVNASETFNGKSISQQGLGTPLITSSSSSSLSSATSSATTSPSTVAAASQDDAESRAATLRILGIVLGSIGGVAVLLVIILLFLRWRRNRRTHQEAGHQRRASGLSGHSEKETLELDRGIGFRGHAQNESQGSFSSVAILMGKVGGTKSSSGMISRKKGSNGSDSSSAFNKKYKTAISKPIPQNTQSTAVGSSYPDEKNPVAVTFAPTPQQSPAPAQGPSHNAPPSAHQNANAVGQKRGSASAARRGSTRRSSGWNRYWSGGNSLSVLGFGGSKRSTYGDNDDVSDRSSNYSEHTNTSSRVIDGRETLGSVNTNISQPSALPPPLKLQEPPHRLSLSRVHSGSPTISQAHDAFPQSGEIGRHASVSSISSYGTDGRDAFSSGIPESIADEARGWDPVGWGATNVHTNSNNNHASVAYSESNYGGPRTTIGTYAEHVQHQRNPSSASRMMPAHSRGPSVSQGQSQKQPQVGPQDMSWLNLGDGRI